MLGIVPRTKSLRGAKVNMGFPGSTVVKNWPANAGDERKVGLALGQEEPLGEEMVTRSSILAWREFHGQRNLAGYSPGVAKSRTWLSSHVNGREQIILLFCTEVCHDYKNAKWSVRMEGDILKTKQGWSEVKVLQLWPTLRPHGLYSPWNSPGHITRVGSFSLLHGIFPTQGSNPGLPHCRWILYQLSHKGSPRILGWVAYPFSRGSPQPRNQTGVSCIAGGFFTYWAMREAKQW